MEGVASTPSEESNVTPNLERESRAAVKIQALVRGVFARQAVLPRHIGFKDYAPLVKNVEGMRKNSAGKTAVYFPSEMNEIILKKSGKSESKVRFHQMQEVRTVLRRQGASHLVIPKAVRFGEFLVEMRLPIESNTYHNMCLYQSDPQLFDEVVKELVAMSKEVYLSDVVSNQLHPSNNIVGNTVRYDNLPLFVVEENGKREGKIGLIDLEHAVILANKMNELKLNPERLNFELMCKGVATVEELIERDKYAGFVTLARIFPYHKDMIIVAAAPLPLPVVDSLKMQAAMGEKYYQKMIVDHVNYIERKGVSFELTQPLDSLSAEREAEIAKCVKEELLALDRGENPIFLRQNLPLKFEGGGFLKGDKEAAAEALAAPLTKEILSRIRKTIQKTQNEAFNHLGKNMSSMTDLLNTRSLCFQRYEIDSGILFNDRFKESISGNSDFSREIEEQLAHRVIEELVKGGEFFDYDPGYNTSSYMLCWLRF